MNPKHTITTKHFPKLSYQRYGSGPAIMLLHGFPSSGKIWKDLVFPLSQSHTLLIPDIPGAGESILDGEATSMEELATIIPAILDDAGVDQCILGGHSMGGYVSLAAAESIPHRLSGLALIHSTALADTIEKKEKRRKSIELIRKGGKDVFVRGMVPDLFSEAFKRDNPDVIEQQIEDGMQLAPPSFIAFYNAMIDRPERLDVLRNASFPVLFILGNEDKAVPYESCIQQTTLPDVCFVKLYEPCGHMSMIEQKKILQPDLLNFVNYCLDRKGAQQLQ